MTAITDAKLVVETLLGKTVSNAKMLNIGKNMALRNPYGLWDDSDVDTASGEALAQHILQVFLTFGRRTVRDGAEFKAAADARTAVDSAGQTAETDLS